MGTNKHRDTNKTRYRELASLDHNGNKVVDMCRLCGATNQVRHKHHAGTCVECGKLYDRWRKAVRTGDHGEIRRLKPILLQRYEHLREIDSEAATRSESFYKKVMEVQEMNKIEQTTKVCKQCGRELSVDHFRPYVPRGRGVYNTTTGRSTLCKDCESINSRAASALKRNDEKTIDKLRTYYQALSDRGFPPVTAAARKILGVDPDVGSKSNLDSLLGEVLGTGGISAEKARADIETHCRLLRGRGYACADVAYAAHKQLIPYITDAELLAELNELIEDWYDDEDR